MREGMRLLPVHIPWGTAVWSFSAASQCQPLVLSALLRSLRQSLVCLIRQIFGHTRSVQRIKMLGRRSAITNVVVKL